MKSAARSFSRISPWPAEVIPPAEAAIGTRPRAVIVGETVPPRILAAVEAQAEVEFLGVSPRELPRDADLVLFDAALGESALFDLLKLLGPGGDPGRPAVLLALAAEARGSPGLLEEVDEIVSDLMGDAELQVRMRAVLRARQAQLDRERANSELQVLYAKVESLAGRMAEELRLASQVQRSLLPPPFAHERLEVAREYIPVREIGGDYYDLVPLGPDRLAIALGDVMGKGVPAALLAANLKACLRAHLQSGELRPGDLIEKVNRLFWEVTPKGLFASLFFGVLDTGKGILEFVNAGHDHPFLIRKDGTLRDLDEGGTVLGLLEDSRYERGAALISEGDVLVLYSDGLTDHGNGEGEFYGVHRLKEAARRNHGAGSRLLLYSLLGDVQGFAKGQPAEDDMTLIVARIR